MANCKECLHYKVCAREGRIVQIDEHTWAEYNQLDDVEVFCGEYMSADVVPKSEVEKYKLAVKIAEEERNKLLNHYFIDTNIGNGTPLQRAKAEIAREIFEEIDRAVEDAELEWGTIFGVKLCIAELKKKYTEG